MAARGPHHKNPPLAGPRGARYSVLMMDVHPPMFLPDPQATQRLATVFAPLVRAGDVLLLQGLIGAGKTHFARALIHALLPVPEDVPSPTFTLVQVYEAPEFEIWHADLYRLSGPDEVIELGLFEAFDTALCLIEWPEKLGSDRPKAALTLQFSIEGEGRVVAFQSDDADWRVRLTHV